MTITTEVRPQRAGEVPAPADAPFAPTLLPATHYPALDGLRGMAILMVMFYHFTGEAGHSGVKHRLLTPAASFGWSGVDLFFVLSGFLITGILYDAKGSPRYFLNFYARRSLRVFPLYYGLLTLVALGIVFLPPRLDAFGLDTIKSSQAWMWLYLTNVVMTVKADYAFGLYSHLWSLAVEEQFYLVWPAVVALCSRRTLIRLCILLVPVSAALRLALGAKTGHNLAGYLLTPCRMDSFAVGGLLAILGRSPRAYRWLKDRSPWLLAGSAALVGLIIFVKQDGSHYNRSMGVFGFSLLALAYGSLLFLALSRPETGWFAGLLNSRALRSVGKYSYGLYILHQPLFPTFQRVFSPPVLARTLGSDALAIVAFNLLCGLVSFGIAYLSWQLFEKHFLRLKRYFPAGQAG